nr:MAG TPA: hypothetical protein [Caudoviricetes sp.]
MLVDDSSCVPLMRDIFYRRSAMTAYFGLWRA